MLDLSKPIQTRDGRRAFVSDTATKDGSFLAVVNVKHGNNWKELLYWPDGTTDDKTENFDIINTPVKHKLEGWLLIQHDCIYWYHDKPDVNKVDVSIACLDLAKFDIEFEEGEGLE